MTMKSQVSQLAMNSSYRLLKVIASNSSVHMPTNTIDGDPRVTWCPDTPRCNQIISNSDRTFAYLRTICD